MKPLSEWKLHELRLALTNPEFPLGDAHPEGIMREILRRHKSDVLEMAASTVEKHGRGNTVELAERIRRMK
jgi:hypothetical protein